MEWLQMRINMLYKSKKESNLHRFRHDGINSDEPWSQEWGKSLLISKRVGMQVERVWRVIGSHTGLLGTSELVGMPVYIRDTSNANVKRCMPVQHHQEQEQETALSQRKVAVDGWAHPCTLWNLICRVTLDHYTNL